MALTDSDTSSGVREERTCDISFAVVVIEYPKKSNFRKGKFILDHSCRIYNASCRNSCRRSLTGLTTLCL